MTRLDHIRLLAERVMGWPLTDDHATIRQAAIGDGGPVLFRTEGGEYGVARPDRPARWNPFGDWNDASDLIDAMSDTTKETWSIFVCSTGVQVVFNYEGGRGKPWTVGEHEVLADTLPEAVSLAALKALGVEVSR